MGFFDDFMGKSQREDIARARAEADAKYAEGLGQFTNTTRDYLDKSVGYLTPGMENDRRVFSLLGDILGLNGADPQKAYFSNFQNDPGFNATLDAGVEALDRSAAARGLLRSGGQQKSLFDFGQRLQNDFFNQRVNNLFGLFGQGQQGATAAAGLTSDAGNRIADAQFGTSQLFANNAINTGNALAQSRGIGINNILGSVNAIANLAGAFTGAPRPGASPSNRLGFALPGQRA